MKTLLRLLAAAALMLGLAGSPVLAQTPTGPKTLVLYDAPPGTEFEKLGLAYAIMLRNLLGHFDAQTDMLPVQQYTAGQMGNYSATFYLGAYYDNLPPAAFLADASTTNKTLVWFKHNLWHLAWNGAYNFSATRGFDLVGLRGLNAAPTASNPAPGFFDTVQYKGKSFVKYYAFNAAQGTVNADPEMGLVTVTNPSLATVTVPVRNSVTAEVAPYVTRSGNFWYVADMPFSYIGPRDRYLVMADLLYDILGVPAPSTQKAMVRLEDVSALVSVSDMQTLTNYLHGRGIPFSIAVIPQYMDPNGVYNGGVPQQIPLSNAGGLKTALNYALARGGEIVMHGFTHQYGTMNNPHTGISGDDYEFWNIVANSPVAEDSVSWVTNRLSQGLNQLTSNGYTPVAWEAPHYHQSATTSRVVPLAFAKTYQRVVYFTADTPNFSASVSKDFSAGQMFPYVIAKDHYGQRVLPENLGNIEYDISGIDPTSNYNYTAQDICTNAEYAKTVRGGYASFFFHPFWLEPALGTPGFQDFQAVIDCITQLGFTWVAPSAAQ